LVAARAAQFEFLAIGDVPYGESDGITPNAVELGKLDRLAAAANARAFAFTVHVGDIKRGSNPCTRGYFQIVRNHFGLFQAPFIYTPGDNEWTDCHRAKSGMQPPAALQAVREVFFPNPRQSLGKRAMKLQSQADSPAYATFIENARWMREGVYFATLHVVGSNDNLPDTAPGDPVEQSARSQAALAWLAETMTLARQSRAPGVVFFMQADPWVMPSVSGAEPAFTPLLLAFEQEVARYDGAVLLVHGDGHTFCMNHPLRVKGRVAESFTRVQVFGEAAVHGVQVKVDTATKQVFSPSTFVVKGNPIAAEDSRCPTYR
ncbi:MAG TPA: hypothetical protein VF678_04835, partial [bacterium]